MKEDLNPLFKVAEALTAAEKYILNIHKELLETIYVLENIIECGVRARKSGEPQVHSYELGQAVGMASKMLEKLKK